MPVTTSCPYCALQCAMTLTPAGAGAVVAAGAGGLCREGWTSADLLTSPHRLTSRLVRDRKGGPLRETSWDEALDRAAAGLAAAQSRAGTDAVAVFGGGGLANEKAYLLSKFTKTSGSTQRSPAGSGSTCSPPGSSSCR